MKVLRKDELSAVQMLDFFEPGLPSWAEKLYKDNIIGIGISGFEYYDNDREVTILSDNDHLVYDNDKTIAIVPEKVFKQKYIVIDGK